MILAGRGEGREKKGKEGKKEGKERGGGEHGANDALERISSFLPFPPYFNPYLDAFVDILCAALLLLFQNYPIEGRKEGRWLALLEAR